MDGRGDQMDEFRGRGTERHMPSFRCLSQGSCVTTMPFASSLLPWETDAFSKITVSVLGTTLYLCRVQTSEMPVGSSNGIVSVDGQVSTDTY